MTSRVALLLATLSSDNLRLFSVTLAIVDVACARAAKVEPWWRWTCGLAAGVTIARLARAMPY